MLLIANERSFDTAEKHETSTSHRLTQYYYKRLLDLIDANEPGYYQESEYLRALHYPSYQDALQRIIAKHPSEWYYGKDDRYWKNYLDTLTKDAPLWKAYAQGFIEKLSWMKEVPELVPEPWHMHPVVFLSYMKVIDGITYAQLKTIFPHACDEDIKTVVDELSGNLVAYKLDTKTRLRHFFSQIRDEVGCDMKGETESFQFSPESLASFSRYYRERPAEAAQDGYLKNAAGKIIRKADEHAIGRKHYQRLNGNRTTHQTDGFNFRGRGLIQITGYEKYSGFARDYSNYWTGDAPDVISQPELVNNMPYAIRSAIWFWLKYEIYNAEAGFGYDDVKKMTKKINGGNMGLKSRQSAYSLCEKVFL